jgi:hypothetical protein
MREETKAYKLAQEVHAEFTKWAEDVHDVPLSPNFYLALEKLISFDFSQLEEAFRPSSLITYLGRLSKLSSEVFEAIQLRSRYRPSVDFFQALHRVTSEIFRWPDNHKDEKKPESIEALLKKGLTYSQIGLKYELINPASQAIQDASKKDEPVDIESIKTLSEAYQAKLSIGAASDLLGLPVVQVQEFYEREDSAEDEIRDDDTDDPPWAKGIAFDSLCLKASELGIVTRKNMKRATVIQRIEEAMENGKGKESAV